MSMLHPPTRKSHPTLFKLVCTLAAVNLIISIFLILGSPQALINFSRFPETGIVPPLYVYSIGWIIAAWMLMHGLKGNSSYRWTRRGLTLSAMIGGFWAFGFWTSFITGRILGISAPLLWSFYSAVCVVITGEPAINPLSVLIANGEDTAKTQRDKSND